MNRARLIASAALLTILALGIWAFVFEPAFLTTRKHSLLIPHWSAEHAGLRVAVLADLHVGSPYNGIPKLHEIVDLTNSLKPDLIVIPGDFVIQGVLGGTFVAPEEAAAVLARLSAPLGVWACLGNHDWWLGAPRVVAALEKRKIGVLEDKAVRIDRGGAHFWLVGISDFRQGPHDVRKAMGQVTDDAPVLMFTHNPDVFPSLSNRFSLLIAGHTHGGQVHLPLLGRPIVPSEYGQRFAHGHVVEGGRHLFVGPGLGTSILPVRFGVPPEVTLLELQPEPSS
jgi:predicted MPP superfamily phosphohydrolase